VRGRGATIVGTSIDLPSPASEKGRKKVPKPRGNSVRVSPRGAMMLLAGRQHMVPLPLLLLHCGWASPPAASIVACEPCAASDARQDFVLTAAGELQHSTALCGNATCAGDPAQTGCWPLQLAECSALGTRAARWFNHTSLGGLLTSNGHALDYGTWAPGTAQAVGLGHFTASMSWERWKIDAAAKRISTVTGTGATCCLALSKGGPAPAPTPPAPPPASEQPCRGHKVEISAARIRVGVCVGDQHNNATYLSSLSTLSGNPPSWSGSVLMPVGGMHAGSPEQTYDSMLSTTSVEVVDSAGKRTWNAAKGGHVTKLNSSAVLVSGIQLRAPAASAVPVAVETWLVVATEGGELLWTLERNYSTQAELCADRFPSLLLVKGIWSMFDSAQVMNMSSGAGFASAPDPAASSGIWFEAIYPQHKRQLLRQSPTGVQLEMEIATHTNFSLATAMLGAGGARPGDDVRRVSTWQWIGGPTSVGATTVDRCGEKHTRTRHTVVADGLCLPFSVTRTDALMRQARDKQTNVRTLERDGIVFHSAGSRAATCGTLASRSLLKQQAERQKSDLISRV
jgi:hypothetical protein